MSESKEEAKAPSAEDPELEELLDSALQEMHADRKKRDSIGGSSVSNLGEGEEGVDWNPSENVWSEQFLQQAASTFESNMAALLSSLKGVPEESISQDQIAATFQMMAEAAAQVMNPAGSGEEPQTEKVEKPKAFSDVSAAIAQTLESMNANSDNLQTPFSDADLNNMFAGLNMANPQGGGEGGNMFVPFMEDMMRSLLSKEVLYPSLKDVVDRYPKWLMDNREKLEKDELERFTKQCKLYTVVCNELETEQESDPEDVKKKRFETVLALMQQMQDLGQPPPELAGELAGAPPMAAPAVPDPNQCKPM